MDLKKVVLGLVENADNGGSDFVAHNQELIKNVLDVEDIDLRPTTTNHSTAVLYNTPANAPKEVYVEATDASREDEENFSLEEQEKEMIRKALIKHKGRRKKAANELGISERTLYRKIKQYDIE